MLDCSDWPQSGLGARGSHPAEVWEKLDSDNDEVSYLFWGKHFCTHCWTVIPDSFLPHDVIDVALSDDPVTALVCKTICIRWPKKCAFMFLMMMTVIRRQTKMLKFVPKKNSVTRSVVMYSTHWLEKQLNLLQRLYLTHHNDCVLYDSLFHSVHKCTHGMYYWIIIKL